MLKCHKGSVTVCGANAHTEHLSNHMIVAKGYHRCGITRSEKSIFTSPIYWEQGRLSDLVEIESRLRRKNI